MKALFGLIVFFICIVAVSFTIGGEVIEPGYMGVRRIGFGPGEGFQEPALEPGFHWSDPFGTYSTILRIPSTVQLIRLFRGSEQDPATLGAIEVQTTNGAQVLADVLVVSRFYKHRTSASDGSVLHGGPADLLESVGTTTESWTRWIRRNAEDELKRSLGTLSTAQFYDPQERDHRALRAAEFNIKAALAPYGIEILGVFLGRYSYKADAISQAIARKNLQEQEERLNATRRDFAKVSAELQKTEADYTARIETLRIQGETEAKVIRSEGALYETKKQASADLEINKALAESDRLRVEVLQNQLGSDVYVARELVPLLTSVRGGVVSGYDPLDIEQMVERLGLAKKDGAQ